jgi:hypothetical protein
MAIDWSQILKDAAGYFSDNASTIAAGGLGAGGLALALKGYEDIGKIGERAYGEFAGEGGLAEKLSGMLEFQPYTVTSATGGQFGMTQDPNTGEMQYQLQLSPEEQQLYQDQLQRAGMFFEQAATPVADREQEVYQRMRTAMSPEEERQRLALEQRLAAQGRLGVTTGMFGGTPEALTLAKAQEEARNQNAVCRTRAATLGWLRYGYVGCWLYATGTGVSWYSTRNDCC